MGAGTGRGDSRRSVPHTLDSNAPRRVNLLRLKAIEHSRACLDGEKSFLGGGISPRTLTGHCFACSFPSFNTYLYPLGAAGAGPDREAELEAAMARASPDLRRGSIPSEWSYLKPLRDKILTTVS